MQGANSQAAQLLFSLREAAHVWGVAYWTVVDWVRQGRVATVKLGRLRRVTLPEIERVSREGLR